MSDTMHYPSSLHSVTTDSNIHTLDEVECNWDICCTAALLQVAPPAELATTAGMW
jgi:hypothetical protein